MSDWRWAAARAAGTSHDKNGLPCQDAAVVTRIERDDGAVLIAVASDGAGSARHSREGARIVTRGFAAAAEQWFATNGEVPDGLELQRWVDALRAQIDALATARDAAARDFAATLVACIATPTRTVVAHVGDGAAVIDDGADGYVVASWPRKGEYANQTDFITAARCVPRVTIINHPARALAVFSDGIEELVLDDRNDVAHPGFFDGVFRPLRVGTVPGRDPLVSRAYRELLTSDMINDRTDDDKSLAAAARIE